MTTPPSTTPNPGNAATEPANRDFVPPADPFALFETWFGLAAAHEINDPNAVALATATADGAPSLRMVLLKGVDDAAAEARGFVFFTNLESRKGEELARNPRAALCFYWKSLRRQVRVEGPVTPVEPAEADAYYASRARGSRIGAWASAQSRPLADRATLEQAVDEADPPLRPGGVGRAGAAAAALVRLPPGAVADRVLAGAAVPPARPGGVRAGPRAAGATTGCIRDRRSPDRAAGGDQARRDRLLKLATTVSVSVASTLAVLKLAAWLVTGSAAILSSLLDSLVDVAASGILLISVRHALRPPDRSHRFGHGKAEPLGAIAQAAFVGGSALLLIFESAGRFITPTPVVEVPLGIAVMSISLVATVLLVVFQRGVARRTGSTAIEADRLNYIGDTATSVVVLAVLVIGQRPGWLWLDPAAAIGVALWLLVSAARIARRAVDHLMDRELPQRGPGADRRHRPRRCRGRGPARPAHPQRRRHPLHRAACRDGGRPDPMAGPHVCDRVEAALSAAFPDAEVILHQEPAGLDDERLDHRIYKR